jgi:hypothetical protein
MRRSQPVNGADLLEALARQGPRQMLQPALEDEVAEHLQRQRYERSEPRAWLSQSLFAGTDTDLGQEAGGRQRPA